MPNYIKNRLEIIGSKEQIDAIHNKYSTKYERKPHKSYNDELTFENKETGEYGWLTKKGEFRRHNHKIVNHIPEGFTQHFIESWVRFPDFEKVVPMPKTLNISSDSWLSPLDNQFARHTEMKQHIDELKEHCATCPTRATETIENFIAGIKNYIEHGHATWYSWSVANWGTKWNASSCVGLNENTFEFDTAWSCVDNLIHKISLEFPEVKFIYEWADEDTGSNCGTIIYLNGEIERNIPEGQSKEAYDLAFKLSPQYKDSYKLVDGKYEYVDEE